MPNSSRGWRVIPRARSRRPLSFKVSKRDWEAILLVLSRNPRESLKGLGGNIIGYIKEM